ncbi:hypothetical protein CRYUN_Cryun34aG0038500 [Craigia yunnanensis]
MSDGARINSWLYAAVRHKVQRLALDLHFSFEVEDRSFMLPHCLFTCESLKELDLDLFYVLKVPSYIFFPSLKILRLANITFPDDHSAQKLFSACPNLMKLSLLECLWNVKAVHISAPMLEEVHISEGRFGCEQSCQFMISGMNLQSFFYCGQLKNDLCIFDVPSLDKATFYGAEDIGSGGRMRVAAYRGFKLFMGLANLKSLVVSSDTLQILSYAEELISHLPPILNLNHLVVKDYEQQGDFACRGLMKILQNSPHLESLYFAAGEISREEIARICIAVLESSYACDKTFEVKSVVPFSEPFTVHPENPHPVKYCKIYFKTLKDGVTGK